MNLKAPDLSIIIPTKNSAGTLSDCLRSVFMNIGLNYEIFVIDCGSQDGTELKAQEHPVDFVRIGHGLGKGSARNEGAHRARADILVFIDADVVIPSDALKKIKERMDKQPELAALNGLLSRESPISNFFSKYKNYYMNYRFQKMPEEIDFLFTSFSAIRRESFVEFTDDLKPKDTEVGQKMVKKDKKRIFLDKTLEVVHLKKYSFLKIIANDFLVPFGWAKIFLEYNGIGDLLTRGRYAHSDSTQIFSILSAVLAVIFTILGFYSIPYFAVAAASYFLFLMCNQKFFRFIATSKSNFFLARSILFTFLDSLVMFLGIAVGFAIAGTNKIFGVKARKTVS